MKIRPSILIEQDQKILTLKYTFPGGIIYALPGGNLEFGETLVNALTRELQEEIKLEVEVGEIKYIAEVLLNGENTIHFVFNCIKYTGVPHINPLETKAEEIVWLPKLHLADKTLYPNIGQYLSQPEVFLGVINQPHY